MWDALREDILSVTNIAKPAGILVKTIFETTALTLEEVAKATEIAIEAQADFVKTSTGFAGGGAVEDVIKTMMETAKGRIKVKPSGGIRDLERALMFVEMGAERLGVGSSSTPIICDNVHSGATNNGY